MTHLYTFNSNKITDADFLAALGRIDIRPRDTLFVHSDITVFGKPVITGNALLSALVALLEESIGESGTLIMPTFSYSFTKGEPYDPHVTPSTVGSLTEFFRKQDGVKRNLHPIFSVVAWGKHADDCLHVGKDSFGTNTIFELLRTLDAKIIFLGASFHSLTFMHHIEQTHNVPYRYSKEFSGTIIGDKPYQDTYTYFVRPLDGSAETDMTQLELNLRTRGLLREVAVGNGFIRSVRARDAFQVGIELLDADPYAFVGKNHG